MFHISFVYHSNKYINPILLWMISLFLYLPPVIVSANDAVFKPSEHLSPDILVTLVMQRNPDLQMISAESDAAHERVNYIGELDDPMINYSVAPRTLYDSTINGRHSIALSQRLPWQGKRQLLSNYARNQANANQEKLKAFALALTEKTRIAFAQWYFVHAALSINHHNQSLVDEFKQIAEIKFSAAKVSKQDVLQAELEILQLKQREIELAREQKDIQASLNQLLNRPANTFVPEPEQMSIDKARVTSNIPLAQILTQHPQMRQLEQHIAAEKNMVQLADKNAYPDFTLNIVYNGVMDPEEKRLQVGISMNIPFGEKIAAKQREARARLKELERQQQSLRNIIQSQHQQVINQIKESEQLSQLYEQQLIPLAQENLTTAKQDYETGRGDFLSLITAEKNLSQTQLALERIVTDFYQRLVHLEQIIGGVSEPEKLTPFDGDINLLSIDTMGE